MFCSTFLFALSTLPEKLIFAAFACSNTLLNSCKVESAEVSAVIVVFAEILPLFSYAVVLFLFPYSSKIDGMKPFSLSPICTAYFANNSLSVFNKSVAKYIYAKAPPAKTKSTISTIIAIKIPFFFIFFSLLFLYFSLTYCISF